MSTSITDARYTSLHFTPGALIALQVDEPPETGWSVMPGFEQDIDIPFELEPPRMDADETLPNMLHPSYPYGRPQTLGTKGRPGQNGPGNLLGTIGMVGRDSAGVTGSMGGAVQWGKGRWGEEGWSELAFGEIVEQSQKKEVPPGMAGAKRPPSPPSPALQPHQVPPARSQHLRNLLARQRQATPPLPSDAFDAPVPNETYMEEGESVPAANNNGPLPGMTGVGSQEHSRRTEQGMDSEDETRPQGAGGVERI